MPARRPLIRAPLLVAFVATMSLGAVELVRNWPEAKTPPAPRTGTVAGLVNFLEGLDQESEPMRGWALHARRDRDVMRALRSNADDNDAATLAVLALTRDERPASRLAAIEGCSVARAWLQNLAATTNEAVQARCLELLDDDDPQIRSLALTSSVSYRSPPNPAPPEPRLLQRVEQLLGSPDVEERDAALSCCFDLGPTCAPFLPSLLLPAADNSSRSLTTAMLAVSACDVTTPATLQWLSDLLLHEDPDVRSLAAHGIGEHGKPGVAVAPELLALLKDAAQPDDVAKSAAQALAELPLPSELAEATLGAIDDRWRDEPERRPGFVVSGKLARRAGAAEAAAVRAQLQESDDSDLPRSRCALAHLVSTHGTADERQQLADELTASLREDESAGFDSYLFDYAEALVALASSSQPLHFDPSLLRARLESQLAKHPLRANHARHLLESLPQ